MIRHSLFASLYSLRRVAAIDNDRLHSARAGAAKRGGFVVFLRREASDALLESWEFDHDEALEFVRPFHDLKTAAAGQNLAAIFGDDRRHAIRVFLVRGGIVDLGTRDPISWHRVEFLNNSHVILRWPPTGPARSSRPMTSSAALNCDGRGR